MKTAKTQEENITINQQPKRRFIIIYESVYKEKLSIEELGLLTKLIACAPNFKITKLGLATILNCSKETIEKASNGLKAKGFLKIENNFKSGSKWTISQEPFIAKINTFTLESLVDALTRCVINTNDLRQIWKNKYIDYAMYQNVIKAYKKELTKILKTPWLDNEE